MCTTPVTTMAHSSRPTTKLWEQAGVCPLSEGPSNNFLGSKAGFRMHGLSKRRLKYSRGRPTHPFCLEATPTCCEYHKDGPIKAFVSFTTAARICSQYSHHKEVDNQSQEHVTPYFSLLYHGANVPYPQPTQSFTFLLLHLDTFRTSRFLLQPKPKSSTYTTQP